ncbi:hypothetical protein DPMN_169930 [Dreissena polymorpha]|uniref:Uncharacterized protein n=1 Tax=Dreissena polymorpha TaxID=45954 RepID=A0A9D4DWF1_DREPO|nr:hypothetical protein DPMN_169930 [Dreissena polymorpha]
MFYWYRWQKKEDVLDIAAAIDWMIDELQLPIAFDYESIYQQMNVDFERIDNVSMSLVYSSMLEDDLTASRSQ